MNNTFNFISSAHVEAVTKVDVREDSGDCINAHCRYVEIKQKQNTNS